MCVIQYSIYQNSICSAQAYESRNRAFSDRFHTCQCGQQERLTVKRFIFCRLEDAVFGVLWKRHLKRPTVQCQIH